MQQQGTILALRSYPLSLWEKVRVKGRGSLGAPAMRQQALRNDIEGSFLSRAKEHCGNVAMLAWQIGRP